MPKVFSKKKEKKRKNLSIGKKLIGIFNPREQLQSVELKIPIEINDKYAND